MSSALTTNNLLKWGLNWWVNSRLISPSNDIKPISFHLSIWHFTWIPYLSGCFSHARKRYSSWFMLTSIDLQLPLLDCEPLLPESQSWIWIVKVLNKFTVIRARQQHISWLHATQWFDIEPMAFTQYCRLYTPQTPSLSFCSQYSLSKRQAPFSVPLSSHQECEGQTQPHMRAGKKKTLFSNKCTKWKSSIPFWYVQRNRLVIDTLKEKRDRRMRENSNMVREVKNYKGSVPVNEIRQLCLCAGN